MTGGSMRHEAGRGRKPAWTRETKRHATRKVKTVEGAERRYLRQLEALQNKEQT